MEEFVRKHVDLFLDFVEGRTPLEEWRTWIDRNAAEIEAFFGRRGFIKLKHRSYDEVTSLLRRFNISFERREDLCYRCGAKLFRAIPGKTTKQEIVEFALSAKFRGAEQIAEDGWIHPGVYCPNNCIFEMHNCVREKF